MLGLRALVRTAAVVLVLAWLPAWAPAADAAGATLTVTTTDDNTTTDGLCSLREAVANANSDSASSPDCTSGSGDDTIQFDLGTDPATITLDPTLGALGIAGTLTVDGGGTVTVDGAGATGLFSVSGSSLTVERLSMTGGTGSALLALPDTFGGAIAEHDGSVDVRDSTFSGNLAQGTDGEGGALVAIGGSLSVDGSTFVDNQANDGGAIGVTRASVSVHNSTFVHNSARNGGGGAINSFQDSGQSTTVAYSTFLDNSTSSTGGALRMFGPSLLSASLLQDNGGGNCDSQRTPTDGGYNISSDASCVSADTSSGSTATGLDPAGLADNGGPTQTVALQEDSNALDLVPVGQAGCGTDTTTDQRGQPRPEAATPDEASACDAGAFEAQGFTHLDAAATTVGEAAGHVTITVDFGGRATKTASVSYATADGTATAPSDYTAQSGTLPLSGGGTSFFEIPIVNDQVHERAETFTVTLSDPSDGTTLVSPETETVTIQDDDPARCTIRGTSGDDVLRGTPGPDVICGFGGNDVIRGLGGNDVIHGGRGADTLRGGRGRDLLFGWRGHDLLAGNSGPDALRGGPGNDTLRGGPGRDLLRGGHGHDVLVP